MGGGGGGGAWSFFLIKLITSHHQCMILIWHLPWSLCAFCCVLSLRESLLDLLLSAKGTPEYLEKWHGDVCMHVCMYVKFIKFQIVIRLQTPILILRQLFARPHLEYWHGLTEKCITYVNEIYDDIRYIKSYWWIVQIDTSASQLTILHILPFNQTY